MHEPENETLPNYSLKIFIITHKSQPDQSIPPGSTISPRAARIEHYKHPSHTHAYYS